MDDEDFAPCLDCPRVDDCHMMGDCQGFDPEEDDEPGHEQA